MIVLKICGNRFDNENRDRRELSVYLEQGSEIAVLAKGESADNGRLDTVDGIPVYRYSTKPLGAHAPKALNKFVSLYLWSRFARKLHPDIISGHDLIPGLTIAWMSTLFHRNKPKLIYDSHEFELGRNAKRNAFQKFVIRHWERFLMKRCAFSIMVNDSIADEVQRIHRLKERPIVVRSTPNYWELDEAVCTEKREEFLSAFAVAGERVTFLMMCHGGVMGGRGIEHLIEAVSRMDGVGLVIFGNGAAEYKKALQDLAKGLNAEKKVLFHPAVPIDELWKYVGSVDLEMMPIEAKAKSYYYALPNKFFEAIQSEVPIVASDLPEMKRIIEKYQIGLTCKPGDVDDICRCVKRMREDSAFYKQCKENLKAAKREFCWENEKKVLAAAFETLLEA